MNHEKQGDMTSESVEVRNNESESRFECTVDGSVAFAEYHRAPGRITFTHTEVPESISGGGVASRLVRAES